MVEKTGKRMPNISSLGLIGDKISGGLDFSRGFTYKNQDLDNTHNTADEISSINRKRMEQYLGMEIPKEEPSNEYMINYAKSLTGERSRIANNLAEQGYDFNESVAYLDNYERLGFSNPMGKGLEIFQKKTSIGDAVNREPAGWTLGTLGTWEGLGRIIEGVGNYQFNKTMDKYLPEDVSRIVRYTKYENVPELLSEELAKTNEQISKAEQRLGKSFNNKLINGGVSDEIRQNLEDLYARRDAIRESLNAINDTKKNLPKDKPETARDTAKKMGLKGSDIDAAGQAATESSVYYTTEIAPIYKQVKTRFDMGKIFDGLTKDDFQGLTEGQREDMKGIIEKEKAAYSKFKDISVEELHNKLNDFDLSKSRLDGDDAKGLMAQFKDVMHTKISNMIDDAVEKELPGRGIKNKRLIYNNMLNAEKELKDYAVSGGKRKSQNILKDLRDNTTRSIKIKRGLGTTLRKVGRFRPTTFIGKVIDWFKKNPQKVIEKGKEIVEKGTDSPTVKKIVENKKAINPKFAKQPTLFGSPMDFASVAIGDMLEMGGLESPLEILTEIVSYALETNKLNRENGTDLPLYDEENSYVNQNPYNGLSQEEKLAKYKEEKGYDFIGQGDYPLLGLYRDKSMYEQDWYKSLLEEEEKIDEKYRDAIEDADIEKILNSIK